MDISVSVILPFRLVGSRSRRISRPTISNWSCVTETSEHLWQREEARVSSIQRCMSYFPLFDFGNGNGEKKILFLPEIRFHGNFPSYRCYTDFLQAELSCLVVGNKKLNVHIVYKYLNWEFDQYTLNIQKFKIFLLTMLHIIYFQCYQPCFNPVTISWR